MTEENNMQNNILKDNDLYKISGGSQENTIHPVFMWQCQDCTKYLGKNYDGYTCDACGSKNLKYVRIM